MSYEIFSFLSSWKLSKTKLAWLGRLGLWVVVSGLMLFNAALVWRLQRQVRVQVLAAQEAARPAELKLTLLTAPDCLECYDLALLLQPLKNGQRVKISQEQALVYTSEAGAELVKKYAVPRVPTVLVSGEVEKSFELNSFLQQLGRQAEDGTLVVTQTPAPYLEVASGAVQGKFSVTYLTDTQCKECYAVTLHRQALAQFAMKPAQENFVDLGSASGQTLRFKYRITSAPTLLLSGDLQTYPQFLQVWPSVGTVEKDGTYVFRSGQPLMGAYHDLRTGKVVKPVTASTAEPQS